MSKSLRRVEAALEAAGIDAPVLETAQDTHRRTGGRGGGLRSSTRS